MRYVFILLLLILASCSPSTHVGSAYSLPRTASPPGKLIFLTIDGTGNSAISRTNAARLFEMIDARSASLDRPIATYYAEGVGSRGQIAGLAMGAGMGRDVRQAYSFLTRNYQPGDRIILSGFSRGAYAVRILAGLVALTGIPDLSGMPDAQRTRLVERIYAAHKIGRPADLMKRNDERRKRIAAALAEVDVVVPDDRRDVMIDALAIWDTVEALGLPDQTNDPAESIPHYFIETCNVRHVFHALALDDDRAYSFTPIFTRTELMTKTCPGTKPDVEEVWFAGAHADVGGSYAPLDQVDGFLSGVSLNWMIGRLRGWRLLPEGEFTVFADPLGPIHDAKAYSPAYKLLDRHFRDPLAYDRRRIGEHSRPVVHISALQRLLVLDLTDRLFDNCPRGAAKPLLLCKRDLPQFGFVKEMVPGCMTRSHYGYALVPGQACVYVACETSERIALRMNDYCGHDAAQEERNPRLAQLIKDYATD